MRIKLIAVLISLAFLTACGQKGPLYIPQKASFANEIETDKQPLIVQAQF